MFFKDIVAFGAHNVWFVLDSYKCYMVQYFTRPAIILQCIKMHLDEFIPIGPINHNNPVRIHTHDSLTHISLASLLWDIGKQNSPRCDAAERGVPSVAILFA